MSEQNITVTVPFDVKTFTPVEIAILEALLGTDSDCCYYYSYFESETNYSRAELTPAMATLRKKGYAYFARGLMDEDGEVRGAGHGIVYEKRDEIEQIISAYYGMSLQQVQAVREAIAHLALAFRQIAQTLAPIFRDIQAKLQEAGLIDERGQLTEHARQLIAEGKAKNGV